MAKPPYVDPVKRREIDAKRMAFYEALERGEAKLPNHDFSKPTIIETPTPTQLARRAEGKADKVSPVEFSSEGGMVFPDAEDSAAARTHTKTGQMSRGSLVEEDFTEDEAEEIQEPVPPPQVKDRRDEMEIPEEWRTLAWQDLRGLAAHFAEGAVVTNKETAIRTIEEEIERRNSE